jgi:hypothetical protein
MLEKPSAESSLAAAAAAPLRCAIHRTSLKFTGGATRTLLAPIKRITEHSRHGILPPQKMHLKTVRLFFGAGFRIYAPDIRLRIRIWSFSHGSA